MDKWFKYILPDKDPYHNRGRDQMRKKGGPDFKCLWKISTTTTTTLQLLITCLTKQQLYSFWSPGSPNNNFTASDHLAHQTTTLQLLTTWLTKQQLYSFWSPGSPNNNSQTGYRKLQRHQQYKANERQIERNTDKNHLEHYWSEVLYLETTTRETLSFTLSQ
jgi:hypothetical protein